MVLKLRLIATLIASLIAVGRCACPFAKNNGDGVPCPHASMNDQQPPLISAQADVQISDSFGGIKRWWSKTAAPTPPSVVDQTKPNPGQRTVLGCKCKSLCGAGVTDLYACDWCYTEGNCGHKSIWGLNGKFDYCTYPPNGDFEKKSAEEKTKYFWSKITENTQHAIDYASPLSLLKTSVKTTFDNFAFNDEMPNGRVKGIHTIGSICQFKLEIADSEYTGLFGEGVQTGFIRMGSAAAYSNGGLTPGLGLKFPRSGVPSGNYVALHSLDLGQSWNFFAYNMSNHISAPAGFTKVLAKKFNQASQCAPQVGLSDMAKFSQDGTEHAVPRTPFKLFMIPSLAVQQSTKEKTVEDVSKEMADIKVGTTLYTVYACGTAAGTEAELTPTDGGLEKACGKPHRLGEMVTTSKCTTSWYGDNKFHIRHQRIEDDWKLHPEFLEQYDAATACNGSPGDIEANGAPKSCTGVEGWKKDW